MEYPRNRREADDSYRETCAIGARLRQMEHRHDLAKSKAHKYRSTAAVETTQLPSEGKEHRVPGADVRSGGRVPGGTAELRCYRRSRKAGQRIGEAIRPRA
jgi:hypothetical protein